MLLPWIPARLHGWLDEVATMTYLVVAFLLDFRGAGLVALLAGAAVHFANTRLTVYSDTQRQRPMKAYGLNVHARIELVEGAAIAASSFAIADLSPLQRNFALVLGALQIGAALFAKMSPLSTVTDARGSV